MDSSGEPTEQGLYIGCTSRRWVNRVSFAHSVPAPEDKMAQRVSVEVWNAMYEQDFLEGVVRNHNPYSRLVR